MQYINRIFHTQKHPTLPAAYKLRYWDISNAVLFVRRAGLRVTDHTYSAVNDDVLRENPPTARLFKVRHIGWLGQS